MCFPFSSRAVSDSFCQPLEDRSLLAIQAFLTLMPQSTTAFPEGVKPAPIVVELSAYHFGVTNNTTVGSATGGAGAGKAAFGKLQITKLADDVDPVLLMNLNQGRFFASARLNIMQVGAAKKSKMMEYRFSTVAITSLQISGGGDTMEPTDQVEFVYGSFSVTPTKKPAAALKRLRKAARA